VNGRGVDHPPIVGLVWGGIGVMFVTVVALVVMRSPVFPALERAARVAALEEGATDRDDDGGAKSHAASSAGATGGSKADAFPFGGDKSAPIVLPGQATRDLQNQISQKLRKNDLKGALDALEQLVDADKDAIKDSNVRATIVELSQRVTLLTHGEPERMFGLLAKKMGTTGIDILYQLVTTKGGSRAAKLAEQLLLEDEILERGSDAMQVAWKLRRAKGCPEKKALFDDAAKYGDSRTLGQLFLLNRSCSRRRRDPSCCLEKDKELDATIDALKARGIQ